MLRAMVFDVLSECDGRGELAHRHHGFGEIVYTMIIHDRGNSIEILLVFRGAGKVRGIVVNTAV
jgi:hypothetical protein